MAQATLDDFIEALTKAANTAPSLGVGAVWDLTTAFYADHGFDKLIYVDTRPDGMNMMTTLSPVWVARYQDCDYARIDPFFTHCGATFRPISTGIAYADRHDGLSADQVAMIREAAEFGINAGFSSTIRLHGPSGMTGWNIGSSLDRAEVDRLRIAHEAVLRLASVHAHDALRSLRHTVLSPREEQCLSLLASGLRTKEIARRLMLSPASVELYLRNARQKLGAATREQAIAIATEKRLLANR
ncbi:helix-turn-helix transcriptional regulator [Yoonia vestfoldensis]|uniref:helix-turn-helix transcriptional regulator n=1 Tax=Yoonia vestfoldensis TaxID=245188 RepID=UPI00037C1CEA|nr:LuxR family transcriptional regulator [Yoonia vestfoldensis]